MLSSYASSLRCVVFSCIFIKHALCFTHMKMLHLFATLVRLIARIRVYYHVALYRAQEASGEPYVPFISKMSDGTPIVEWFESYFLPVCFLSIILIRLRCVVSVYDLAHLHPFYISRYCTQHTCVWICVCTLLTRH